jgi:hypothetical protein
MVHFGYISHDNMVHACELKPCLFNSKSHGACIVSLELLNHPDLSFWALGLHIRLPVCLCLFSWQLLTHLEYLLAYGPLQIPLQTETVCTVQGQGDSMSTCSKVFEALQASHCCLTQPA